MVFINPIHDPGVIRNHFYEECISIMNPAVKYSLSLAFENVSLPPFDDILILTYKSQYGKLGVSSSLNALQPERFDVLEVNDHDVVGAVVVNKRILKRLPAAAVLKILRERVFPYIHRGEIVKVDFSVKMFYDTIELTTGDGADESETAR